MPPASEKPISVHTLVLTDLFVPVSSQKANLLVNVVLCHSGERMVSSLCSHVWYSCMRGLCGVGVLSTQFFSPAVECASSVKGFCLDAQQDSLADDRGWFESVQSLTAVGVSEKGCSQTHGPGHDAASQGIQISE